MAAWYPIIDAVELLLAFWGLISLLSSYDRFCDRRRRRRTARHG